MEGSHLVQQPIGGQEGPAMFSPQTPYRMHCPIGQWSVLLPRSLGNQGGGPDELTFVSAVRLAVGFFSIKGGGFACYCIKSKNGV